MTRRLLLLLALLALALAGPGAVRAADGSGSDPDDNIVQAINQKSGSSLFKFAFSLRKVTGEVVDNANAAVAYSSCESCRTTAIAIQIVLVVGSPSTVTPENVAIAINENCSFCESFAYAFQFVIGVQDESVKLTKKGQRELRKILKEFRALKHDDYTSEEFNAQTKALGDRLRIVLRTELKPRGKDDEADENAEDVEDEREDEARPVPPAAPPAVSTTEPTTPTTTATESESTESTTTETEPPPATTETTTPTP